MKELKLNKETVAKLNSNEMQEVKGGDVKPVTYYCLPTRNCTNDCTQAGDTCDDPTISCLSAECIPTVQQLCGI